MSQGDPGYFFPSLNFDKIKYVTAEVDDKGLVLKLELSRTRLMQSNTQ